MTYRQTVLYLDSFVNFEKRTPYPYQESLKLERIKGFLRLIGDPQDSLRHIHVAGTKGKGSVSAFTAFILREHGLTVGLYTSPHLSDVRERIRILEAPSRRLTRSPGAPEAPSDFEGMIPRKTLVSLVERLKPQIEAYCARSPYGALSFFEVYTALAFAYFKERNVDFAVLETGMGGRLDATNVVDPEICAITSISFDHMNPLGNTLTEIAGEKAGIIKSHPARLRLQGIVPRNVIEGGHTSKVTRRTLIVISAPQEKHVVRTLRNRCKEQHAVLYEVGKDIKFLPSGTTGNRQHFSVRGALGNFRDLTIDFFGRHQVINATVAVGLVAGLAKQGRLLLDLSAMRRGLSRTVWPARFEVVAREPLVIIDAAHNGASAATVRRTLQDRFAKKRIVLVMGISRDKDIPEICRQLFPASNEIILAKADNPRAERPRTILKLAARFAEGKNVTVADTVGHALKIALRKTKREGAIVITGSIFLAGQARGLVKKTIRRKCA